MVVIISQHVAYFDSSTLSLPIEHYHLSPIATPLYYLTFPSHIIFSVQTCYFHVFTEDGAKILKI